MDFQKGEVIYIDKPYEWTSFDVVNKIRVLLKRKAGIPKIKVGHAGTLDPLATGLVIICTGKATKQIENYMALEKEYIAEISFGATTPSFDLETEIDKNYPCEHIKKELIEETLKTFIGEQEQVPPVFSAIKIKGKKAYEYARDNKEVEIKSKIINIKSLKLLEYKDYKATLKVICSKGTYIRSLARDLGKALESGAHLTSLRRTRNGEIDIEKAITIEDFEKKLDIFATN